MKLSPQLTGLITAATLLAGCSSQPLSVGTDDVCGSLQALIADYDADFASFRGKGDSFIAGTVYRAKTELIEGHCQIWSWGRGDAAYLCAATSPSLDIAKSRHQQALASVKSCLGPQWQEEGDWRQRAGETDGYASRFRAPDSDALVSVQTTVQLGGPVRHYTNFLYIGGESRADQPRSR
ncbi:hypothetical protein [Marinobacter xestospongiae]|uniref:Lipoprotein n=1 Tax=Marinobacter xestospongiae TaxID=994319 RepID=A0ABU3VZE8_9GAMM|nr:hypothetical protein [Marinobacter xestospongiae]MDV2079629.1 hypothetical protein [Marinobacter xestospongiae]